jgi:hypothetical protein
MQQGSEASECDCDAMRVRRDGDLEWEFSISWHRKKILEVKIRSGGEQFRKDSLFSSLDSGRLVQIQHQRDKESRGQTRYTPPTSHCHYIISWPLRKRFLHFLFMER